VCKQTDLDAPGGIRTKLDLDANGRKKFSFKPLNKASDSEDDFQKKPPHTKPHADRVSIKLGVHTLLCDPTARNESFCAFEKNEKRGKSN
jgi:hypothetical protein